MSRILEAHLASNAVLMIAPLQDWLALNAAYTTREALEERINIPSTSKHYWCYRLHVTLEKLLLDQKIIRSIKDLISNRS